MCATRRRTLNGPENATVSWLPCGALPFARTGKLGEKLSSDSLGEFRRLPILLSIESEKLRQSRKGAKPQRDFASLRLGGFARETHRPTSGAHIKTSILGVSSIGFACNRVDKCTVVAGDFSSLVYLFYDWLGEGSASVPISLLHRKYLSGLMLQGQKPLPCETLVGPRIGFGPGFATILFPITTRVMNSKGLLGKLGHACCDSKKGTV